MAEVMVMDVAAAQLQPVSVSPQDLVAVRSCWLLLDFGA